jgi:hypothetical protein
MAERSDDLLRSRQEAALLLRLDPQNLSASDALRCDLIATLRLSIDSAQADALEGRAADLGRLIVATESLVKLLPSEPPKPAANEPDPRQVMWQIYRQMRERGELGLKALAPSEGGQVEALHAKVAELEARLAGQPVSERSVTAIDPGEADIVPPGERAECDAGPPRGPDDPPPRSTRIIEGVAVRKPAAAPAAPKYDYDKEQGWKDFVLPDGNISPTPMSRGKFWGPV